MTRSLPGGLSVTCGWSVVPGQGPKEKKQVAASAFCPAWGSPLDVLFGVEGHLWACYEMGHPALGWWGGLAWSLHGGNRWRLTLDLGNSQPHLAVLASQTLWAEISNCPHSTPNHAGLNMRNLERQSLHLWANCISYSQFILFPGSQTVSVF